jgi:hypothetical protein
MGIESQTNKLVGLKMGKKSQFCCHFLTLNDWNDAYFVKWRGQQGYTDLSADHHPLDQVSGRERGLFEERGEIRE